MGKIFNLGDDPQSEDYHEPNYHELGSVFWIHFQHDSTCIPEDPSKSRGSFLREASCSMNHMHQEGICKFKCRIPSLKIIDPQTYFKTTGDTVVKLERLATDLWEAAGAARKLANLAKKSRGKAKYLETCQENNERVLDGKVYARRKNPRPKNMDSAKVYNFKNKNRRSTQYDNDGCSYNPED